MGMMLCFTILNSIILRCNAENDERCLEQKAVSREVRLPEVRCRLFYSRPLDRLIGGDFFRELHGRQTRSSLSSIRRAKALKVAVDELVHAYTRRFPRSERELLPFAQILAVLALNAYPVEVDGEERTISIDSLFTLR